MEESPFYIFGADIWRKRRMFNERIWRKRIQERGTNCDACYGERTNSCPEFCLTSHIRFDSQFKKAILE